MTKFIQCVNKINLVYLSEFSDKSKAFAEKSSI